MGKRVLCCGTFDYVHPGHVSFLHQAAALGDELVVIVARDENVKRIKGHYPDHAEIERKAQIEALDIADEVRLGHPGPDLLVSVAEIAPDIIALGYDQHLPQKLRQRFDHCQIVVLESHHPEKYKSSYFRLRQ